MWTDFGEFDPDFEISTEEETRNYSVDPDNFPNPSNFMCLDYYGLKTEDDFKKWWKERTGEIITNFRSFATKSEPSPDKYINLHVEKKCIESGLRKLDVPGASCILFKLGVGKDVPGLPTIQNMKFPFECDNKYSAFWSSVELNDDLYVINLYLSI